MVYKALHWFDKVLTTGWLIKVCGSTVLALLGTCFKLFCSNYIPEGYKRHQGSIGLPVNSKKLSLGFGGSRRAYGLDGFP